MASQARTPIELPKPLHPVRSTVECHLWSSPRHSTNHS